MHLEAHLKQPIPVTTTVLENNTIKVKVKVVYSC